MAKPLKVALLGFGAVGAGVCTLLESDPSITIEQVVVRDPAQRAQQAGDGRWRFCDQIDYALRPDVLLECAGHSAIEQHVLPALRAGIPCILVSVGALATPGLAHRLEASARDGQTSVQLLSGAIGAIDALAAARFGGLSQVRYQGRKPPLAWLGTPAELEFDLMAVTSPVCIFVGSAGEAARRFPKNANVAATVALAGIGLDQTRVELYADPDISENQHRLEAEGEFGYFELSMRGKPLQANPKTSALTVFSAVRALLNRARPVGI